MSGSSEPSKPSTESPLNELKGPVLRRSLAIVTIAWMFGSVWMTTTAGAPITQFARALGASEFQFGLLTALPFIASLLSMPASMLIEATGQRKKIFLWSLMFQRLLWIPIALVPWAMVHWFGRESAPHAMAALLILIFLMHSGQAFGGPAWVSWMADVVPDRRRGKYFARRRQWGMLSAIPAALVVGWLLDHYVRGEDLETTMRWCAAIFIVACICGSIDILMFIAVPDVPKRPQGGKELLHSLISPLRNRQFLWFCAYVAVMVFAVSFMGQFVTLYMIERVRLDNMGVQIMLLVVPMTTQLALMSVWGRAADRMGKKPLLMLAGVGVTVPAFLWVFVTPELWWIGIVASILGAAFWTGIEIANFNLVIEMSDSQRADGQPQVGGSAFMAVNAIVINVAGCLGGLSSGMIAKYLKDWSWVPFEGFKAITYFEVLFIVSGVLRLASVVIFLPFVHEPQARPTVEALRFMTSNIYNNLHNAIHQPLRFVGMVDDEEVKKKQTSPMKRD